MLELIKRVTPDIADMFVIKDIAPSDGNDVYELYSENGKVVLAGSCAVAVACAYYRYLRDFCGAQLSWCGNNSVYESEHPLPEKKVTHVIDRDIRFALSFETYADSASHWDEARWERELDLMAMNGINTVLFPVGYEAVWYYSMLKLDINREDALGFLSSPCFLPLQISGKLDSYLSIVDTDYLKSRIELAKKLLSRMKELGIKPVFPCFNGHVPKSMKGYFSKADIFPVRQWGKFPYTYRVAPDDPLFKKIGDALAEKQTELFGKADYYISCPFDGTSPISSDPSLLSSYGKAVSSLISSINDNAVWVMTDATYSREMTSNVDKNKMLILDISGKSCFDTDGFNGIPFISGMTFNYGGHTVLHGNVKALANNPFIDIRKKYKNAVGTGFFPESLFGNPLYAETALLMMTENKPLDLDSWLRSYAARRFGSDEKCLADALGIICETCYGENGDGRETGSIIAARPSTEIAHTSPFDTIELRYDNEKLVEALRLMLSSKGDYTDGYVFDVCDLTRQILVNKARGLYRSAMEGFEKRDVRLFEASTNAFLKIIEETDALLSTCPEFRFKKHVKESSANAVNKTDGRNFELAYICRVTMFGPFGAPEYYDSCWREWSDLVGGYYAERWHCFFETLAENFKKKKKFSTVTKKQLNGRNLTRGDKFGKKLDSVERKWISRFDFSPGSDEDTLKIAEKLLNKYFK
ncbi:MAG: alpha-N-acetylglucosaminidase [Clostridiales bacterium]|nr:alpha-N-acetylglucosaminidase [Clostridiales bacterium]